MAQAAGDVVRAMFEAFNRGDYGGCFELIDPGVEWEDPLGAPGGGIHRGHAEVRAWFARWLGAWQDFTSEAAGIAEVGEHVIVREHVSATGRTSGVPVEYSWTAIYTVRDGRITRRTAYQDEAAARAALAEG